MTPPTEEKRINAAMLMVVGDMNTTPPVCGRNGCAMCEADLRRLLTLALPLLAPGEDAVAGDWNVKPPTAVWPYWSVDKGDRRCLESAPDEVTARAWANALNRADALLKGGKP